MSELIFLVEKDPSGGYTAKASGLPIFTEGETREGLSANAREAVELYFDNSNQSPRLIYLH